MPRPTISSRSWSLLLSPSCTCTHLASPRIASSSSTCSWIRFRSASTVAEGKAKAKANDRWPGWQPVIGLELHVQLKGNPKLLSSASALYDAEPNTHIQPFDAALPGSLPTLSPEPVRLALLACLALDSDIHPASRFDRKHYFYPDLPAGFQVSQKYTPLAKGGRVRIRIDASTGVQRDFDVGIEQVQLEQDTAKSFHDPDTNMTLVDLNRAGAALVEIVTKPDMRSPEEAAAFVRSLQSILRHVGASDANMDRGELRCDVNVSVRSTEPGSSPGTRCEVKNVNGVRILVGAIESEITRQIASLESNLPVVQSTMGYNAVTNQTYHLRSKEDSPDYRYMPDPELGPIIVTEALLSSLRSALPELPDKAYDRLLKQYGLSSRDAAILVAVGEHLDPTSSFPSWAGEASVGTASIGVRYFETLAFGRHAQSCANWVINDLLSCLSSSSPPRTLLDSPISPHQLGRLLDALDANRITSTNAKSLLKSYLTASSEISWEKTLETALLAHRSNAESIDLPAICQHVIERLPEESDKVRKGNSKVLMRLVGEVMKISRGMADAQEAKKVLETMLLDEAAGAAR